MVLTALELFRELPWGFVSIVGLLVLAIVILIVAYWKRDRTVYKMDGPVGRHF